MATIITKNSQTASAVPSAASLSVGELAVNTADGKLYTEHTGGVVKEIIPSTVVDGGITTAKIADGAITTAKIATGAVIEADIANGAVTVAKISASGTPSSTTFLRGDGSWQAAGGGGQPQYAVFASSGTWTCPTGVTRVFVYVSAGGTGAVRPGDGSYGDNGGREGAASWGYYTVVPGTSYTVTVGAGGSGNNSGSWVVSSSSGGSSFGSFLTIGGSSITQSYDTVSSSAGSITGATFNGRNYIRANLPNLASRQEMGKNTGNNSPVAWSASDVWQPGSGGRANGSTMVGGVGGVVYIEYIG
jgi:hypothetical protein